MPPALGDAIGHIDRLRSEKQMCGVDAATIVTAVENTVVVRAFAFRYRAAVQYERELVCARLSAPCAEPTVAAAVHRRLPVPTFMRAALGDLRPETIGGWSDGRAQDKTSRIAVQSLINEACNASSMLPSRTQTFTMAWRC